MKKLLSFVLVFGVIGSAFGAPSLPADFKMNALFEVVKCVNGGCTYPGSLGNNVVIPFRGCTTGDLGTLCTGSWEQAIRVDEQEFWAEVIVARNEDRNGAASYNLTATVGPVLDVRMPSSLIVSLLNDGHLAHAIRLQGENFDVGNVSYQSSLLIQPEM